MDKSWMEKRRFSVEYIEGVNSFMRFIEDHLGRNVDIHCPCKSCLNVFHQEVVLSQDAWNNLCDYWDQEKVKVHLLVTMHACPHTQGPVSFVPSYHELRKKNGDDFTLVDFYKAKMLDKVEASKETGNPMEPDDAFFEVLGSGHGYIKGLGYGPTPPSTRKTYLESQNAELKELNNKLSEENHELQEKCIQLQENCVQLEEHVKDLKARQEATEAKQAEFEKFMRDMMARTKGNVPNN